MEEYLQAQMNSLAIVPAVAEDPDIDERVLQELKQMVKKWTEVDGNIKKISRLLQGWRHMKSSYEAKITKFMQDNDEPINEVDFVASFDEIEVDYGSGEIYEVEMHDGSNMRLHKLHEDYDPTDKANAVRTLMEAHDNDEILTGVFYIDTQKPTFIDLLNLVDEPLGQLPESQTRPPKSALDSLMASLQ